MCTWQHSCFALDIGFGQSVNDRSWPHSELRERPLLSSPTDAGGAPNARRGQYLLAAGSMPLARITLWSELVEASLCGSFPKAS